MGYFRKIIYGNGRKKSKFKAAQESARKDVERAFGVLKQRWSILRNHARGWSSAKLRNIMYTCIILHNMILEDDGNAICGGDEIKEDLVADELQTQISDEQRPTNVQEVRCRVKHSLLNTALIEHIWSTRHPNNNVD